MKRLAGIKKIMQKTAGRRPVFLPERGKEIFKILEHIFKNGDDGTDEANYFWPPGFNDIVG